MKFRQTAHKGSAAFSVNDTAPGCRLVYDATFKSLNPLSQVHVEVNLTLHGLSAGCVTNVDHFVECPFGDIRFEERRLWNE